MDPHSPRESALLIASAVFAGAALTGSLIYHARSARRDAGVGPGPEAARAAASSASAGAGEASPAPLRTDTLEVHDVPAPGSASFGPASERSGRTAAETSGRGAVTPAASAQAARLAGLSGAAESSQAQLGFDTGAPKTPAGSPAGGSAAGPAAAAAKAPGVVQAGRARKPAPHGSDAGLLDSDARLAARETDLVSQAKGFKVARGDGPVDFSNPESIRRAIAKQASLETAVDSDLRKRLRQLGPDADIEQQRQAAKDALEAHGAPADEIATTNALAAAQGPPGATSPNSAATAVDAAIDATAAEAARASPAPARAATPAPAPVGPEFRPTGPPPAGAMKAYQQYKSAFDEALQKYGVRPEHILALGEQESNFGINMGRTPELQAVAGRPADLKAVYVLAGKGALPAPLPNLRGSKTGAQGPWQFQPATCQSVGCHPYDWSKLIGESVPRLLTLDGYKAGDPQSQYHAFCRYYGKCRDRDADYANDIVRKAANIKAGLDRLNQGNPVAAAAKP